MKIQCPHSVQTEFIGWKDQFLAGTMEPESQYPDYPVAKRWKTWTKFLKSKWAKYSWTEGYEMPCVNTIRQWYLRNSKEQHRHLSAT